MIYERFHLHCVGSKFVPSLFKITENQCPKFTQQRLSDPKFWRFNVVMFIKNGFIVIIMISLFNLKIVKIKAFKLS